MGLMESGATAQVVIGQIGGKSIELSHRGCISPSTQRQTQAARDSVVSHNAKTAINNRRIVNLISARLANDSLPGGDRFGIFRSERGSQPPNPRAGVKSARSLH
jgi:hypothetical protein